MSPTLATHIATRLFPHRWWFLAISLLGMVLLLAALTQGSASMAAVASGLAGPVIFVPWALLCACLWMHPERGSMQPRSRFVGKLPNIVQSALRWYAALFLGLFAFVGLVVWPVLSIAWL